MTVPRWSHFARYALEEDRADDDATTALLGPDRERPAQGTFRAQGRFIVAGLPLVEAVFRELDPGAAVTAGHSDGMRVESGDAMAIASASAATLLAGERVALNYLQRLSGIATATRRAVDAVDGTGAVITDTRKTTPGLRELEKYAVRVGGGRNHRASLADGVLWKDNHWVLLERAGVSLDTALARARTGLEVEVEVETEAQLEAALAAGVTFLLVDNQPPDVIERWVRRAGPDVIFEASGGIVPESAGEYARAGVHRVSIGALTHSPDAAPISFELEVGG